MSPLKTYRGTRPLAVPRRTVEDALQLMNRHGLSSSLQDALSESNAEFRILGNGAFEAASPARSPRNFEPATDVALDAATVNSIKRVMFSANLHEMEPLAAEIVGLVVSRCPPPKYKCPKAK